MITQVEAICALSAGSRFTKSETVPCTGTEGFKIFIKSLYPSDNIDISLMFPTLHLT